MQSQDGAADDPVSIAGREMHFGESVVLDSHEPFRDWLMPVVVIDRDGSMKVNGSAVCIGPGTFVTARHVVDYLLDEWPEDGDAEVWVAWTTGSARGGPVNAFRGQLLSVKRYRRHPRVDLAILTTVLPAEAVERHVSVRWSLRMPELGEAVALLGYPDGRADADLSGDGPTGVVLEYPLMLSLGAVTGHREEWGTNSALPRSWPGFEINAPMPSAMSGGPVIDRRNRLIGFCSSSYEPSPPEHPDWNGYVSLTGFLLPMDVDVPDPDGTLVPTPLADLITSGAVLCDVDTETFHIDENGYPAYRAPASQLPDKA